MNNNITTEEWVLDEIRDIQAISQDFQTYMECKLYLSNYGPDGFTDELILADAYAIIHSELRTMGIVLDESLFEDGYNRKLIYIFRNFFDINNLTELLKNNREWIDRLRDVLENTEADDPDINDVLEFFIEAYPNSHEVQSMYELWLECASTEAFPRHVLAILDDIPVNIATIDDPDLATKYAEFIEEGRTRARIASRLIFDSCVSHQYGDNTAAMFSTLKWEDIEPYLDRYDLDKITDEIRQYAMFDDDFNKDIPEILRAKAKEYMDRHHHRSHHHIEYWSKRNGTVPEDERGIPAPALIVLVAHHYEYDMYLPEMHESICSMLKDAPNIQQHDKEIMIELCHAFGSKGVA